MRGCVHIHIYIYTHTDKLKTRAPAQAVSELVLTRSKESPSNVGLALDPPNEYAAVSLITLVCAAIHIA